MKFQLFQISIRRAKRDREKINIIHTHLQFRHTNSNYSDGLIIHTQWLFLHWIHCYSDTILFKRAREARPAELNARQLIKVKKLVFSPVKRQDCATPFHLR